MTRREIRAELTRAGTNFSELCKELDVSKGLVHYLFQHGGPRNFGTKTYLLAKAIADAINRPFPELWRVPWEK